VHGVTPALNGYLSGMARMALAFLRYSSLGQRRTDFGPGSVGSSTSRPYGPGPAVSCVFPAMPPDGRWRPACAAGGDPRARKSIVAVTQEVPLS
jgi:hypothetical protein